MPTQRDDYYISPPQESRTVRDWFGWVLGHAAPSLPRGANYYRIKELFETLQARAHPAFLGFPTLTGPKISVRGTRTGYTNFIPGDVTVYSAGGTMGWVRAVVREFRQGFPQLYEYDEVAHSSWGVIEVPIRPASGVNLMDLANAWDVHRNGIAAQTVTGTVTPRIPMPATSLFSGISPPPTPTISEDTPMIQFSVPQYGENVLQYINRVATELVARSPALAQAADNMRTLVGRMHIAHRYWRPTQLQDVRDYNGKFNSRRTMDAFARAVQHDHEVAHSASTLRSEVPSIVPIPPVSRGGAPRPLMRTPAEHYAQSIPTRVLLKDHHGVSCIKPLVVQSKFKQVLGGNWVRCYSLYDTERGIVYGAHTTASLSPPSSADHKMMGLAALYKELRETGVAPADAATSVKNHYHRFKAQRAYNGSDFVEDRGVLVPTRHRTLIRALAAQTQRTTYRLTSGPALYARRELWSLPSVKIRTPGEATAATVAGVRNALRVAMGGNRSYLVESYAASVFGPESSPLRQGLVSAYSVDQEETVFGLSTTFTPDVCPLTQRAFVGHRHALLDGGFSHPRLLDDTGISYRHYESEGGEAYLLLDGQRAPRRTTLYGYHNGPRNYHASYPEPRIGVELEVCCDTGRGGSRAEFIAEWQDEDGFILERDGSLSHDFGAEIISPPLPFDTYTEDSTWGRMLAWLRGKRAKSWHANGEYGMHVNLSRAHLTREETAVLVMIANRWKPLMRSIAGRESSFARFNITMQESRVRTAYDYAGVTLSGTDKYSCVNVKRHVLEFRLFRGTLSWEGFMRNIQTVIALRDFVKSMGTDIIGIDELDGPDNFLSFVDSNKDKYTYLHRFLVDKNWIGTVPVREDSRYTEQPAAYAA